MVGFLGNIGVIKIINFQISLRLKSMTTKYSKPWGLWMDGPSKKEDSTVASILLLFKPSGPELCLGQEMNPLFRKRDS